MQDAHVYGNESEVIGMWLARWADRSEIGVRSEMSVLHICYNIGHKTTREELLKRSVCIMCLFFFCISGHDGFVKLSPKN